MDKIKLLKQAKKLHLNTDEKVLAAIEQERKIMEKKLAHFKGIDVSRVLPMTRPIEGTISYLRDDIPNHVSQKEIILKNAPKTNDDFILLQKVVKND